MWTLSKSAVLVCLLIKSVLNGKDYAKATEEDFKKYDFMVKFGNKIKEIDDYEGFHESTKFHRKLGVVIYYSKEKCLQCEQRESVLEEVMDRFKHQVEFYKLNCDTNLQEAEARGLKRASTCVDNYPSQLPSISFRLPQEGVYFPYHPLDFKRPGYEPDFTDPNSLADMIEHYMPVFAWKIKNMEDANHFIEKFGHLNKTMYFGTGDEPPVYFKALTAIYKDRLEYFNVTKRPRWMVVKITNLVKMDKRSYHGEMSFDSVKAYLGLFASKNDTDRRVDTGHGHKRIRDQTIKSGSKVYGDELNFEDFRSNFLNSEQIQFLHVTDTFTMNYPNLIIFQNFYGNITEYLEANLNTLPKKRYARKRFPKEHRPYLLVYPPGNYSYKLKNVQLFGAKNTIEDLTNHVSALLPNSIQSISSDSLENFIVKSLHERKLAVVIFHSEDTVSMGLRKLATMPRYQSYFNFYQMYNPPAERLRQLKINKLAKLVVFLPNPILLAEPDSQEPIDKIYYEANFIFDKLRRFLESAIDEHAQYLRDVVQVSTEREFESTCLQSKRRYCMIFIVNKKKEELNDQFVDRMNDMIILTKYAGKNMTSMYMAAECLPALSQVFRFGEKLIPLVVLYDKKTKSFLRSEVKLNIYDGRTLIDAVVGRKFEHKFIPVEPKIGINLCKVLEEDDL